VNLYENESDLSSWSDLKVPSELSTVWGTLSSFVQTIVSPTLMVTSAGVNLKLLIEIEMVLETCAGAAGGVAGAGAGD
jgi:hypothetical protein